MKSNRAAVDEFIKEFIMAVPDKEFNIHLKRLVEGAKEKGIDLNTRGPDGHTLLYHALRSENLEAAKLLTDNGAKSAMMSAEEKRHIEELAHEHEVIGAKMAYESLKELVSDPEQSHRLDRAFTMIDPYIAKGKLDLNARIGGDKPLLYYALINGNHEAVTYLKTRGAREFTLTPEEYKETHRITGRSLSEGHSTRTASSQSLASTSSVSSTESNIPKGIKSQADAIMKKSTLTSGKPTNSGKKVRPKVRKRSTGIV